VNEPQFSGMTCCVYDAEYERAEMIAFGGKVWIRQWAYGVFEAKIGGQWYSCELADFDLSKGMDEYIASLKRLRDKQQEVTP